MGTYQDPPTVSEKRILQNIMDETFLTLSKYQIQSLAKMQNILNFTPGVQNVIYNMQCYLEEQNMTEPFSSWGSSRIHTQTDQILDKI